MTTTDSLAQLVEKAAGLARLGDFSEVSGTAGAPHRLFDQGDRASAIYVVTPRASDAFIELSHRDLGLGRTLVVDRRRAPAIVAESEFVRWFTQDAADADGHIPLSLSADVIGRATVLTLSFEDMDSVLAKQTSPMIERRLTHFALVQAVSLQSQIRAAQISGPYLRVADRLLAYVVDREGRRRNARPNAFEASDVRRYLADALKQAPSEISRALDEFRSSGVIQFSRGGEGNGAGAGARGSGGQAIRIVDRGHLELIADLSRQRAAVDVTNGRDRLWALVRSGATLSARNVSLELLKQFPRDPELTYLAALSHARMGASADASHFLDRFGAVANGRVPSRGEIERLAREFADPEAMDDDEGAGWSPLYRAPDVTDAASDRAARSLARDVVALAARLAKDAFVAGPPGSTETRAMGARAFEIYRSLADWAPQDHYPAANAATMAALIGETGAAESLADRAAALAAAETDYWAAASRAEALLVRGRVDEALAAIRQAAALANAGSLAGDVGSTRRQLRMLQAVRPEAALLSAELPPFTVAAFSGHLAPDGVSAATMRDHERTLDPALESLYAGERVETLFTALARGADIISARAARRANPDVALHVVLPFDVAEFKAMSVGHRTSEDERDWNAQFDQLAAEMSSLRIVWPRAMAEADRWSGIFVANSVMSGLALLHADGLSIERRLFVAVSSGGAAASLEGAVALTRDWTAKGLEPVTIPCPWRSAASGPDAAERPAPWSVVASFQSSDPAAAARRVEDAARRYASCGVGLLADGSGLSGPMQRETLAAFVAVAAGPDMRGFADYVYAPRGEPKPSEVDLAPDAQTLAAGSLIATERLAAVARYEFGGDFLFAPIGLRERTKKAKRQERAQAPSMSLYRIAVARPTGVEPVSPA